MRDYDPTTGRYIQGDPLGLVDGASVYGYALQNPGRYTDPTGLNNNSTIGGNDPAFGNKQEIEKLRRQSKDPNLSQRERSRLKRRLIELARSLSKRGHGLFPPIYIPINLMCLKETLGNPDPAAMSKCLENMACLEPEEFYPVGPVHTGLFKQ